MGCYRYSVLGLKIHPMNFHEFHYFYIFIIIFKIMGLFKHLEHKLQNLAIHDDQQTHQLQPQQQQQQSYSPPVIPQRDYGRYTLDEHKSELTQESATSSNTQSSVNIALSSSADDLFNTPISLSPPPSCIQSSDIHPVPLPKFYSQSKPIETNNFYGNLLVEDQNLPIWTHPYSVWKSMDDQFKGLGISHTSNSQKVFGDDPNSNPVKYFFSPVGICSMLLSADEFQDQNYELQVGECERFSIGLKFITPNSGTLSLHLVQGMGFITGIYEGNITPRIASKVGIQSLLLQGCTDNGLNKYVATLFDNTKWILYSNALFTLQNQNSILCHNKANNKIIVQVAKLTNNLSTDEYDKAAGAYVIGMKLSGSVNLKNNSKSVNYSFNYLTEGDSSSGKIVQWFLPHQVESADTITKSFQLNGLLLDSTCKGAMKAFLITSFGMVEKLPPKELQFDPWSDSRGVCGYSDYSKRVIKQIADQEIRSFDVISESDTDSMYTAGKILDKGAFMLYAAAFIINDDGLAKEMLDKMKKSFDKFIKNQQKAPLCYDTHWKGVVSTSGLKEGNFYCDFGNCFYNDHHFHYGYHIHAAALVALVDKKVGDGMWMDSSKQWVETLIRDVCNPSDKDEYFPVFRSFDFFNGHSFANGLFAHGDGKDEESSSEDYHCYYGIKLWGLVTGNNMLSQLASLILSIESRAMGIYMLYKDDNNVVPANFKRNKVSGILFENKIDHATYFGMNKEYIHGIHMIPLTPVSSFIRSTQFVTEEWKEIQLGPLANSIDSGWKGLLMLNSAIYEPQTAWEFFKNNNFQSNWLDNGMSRTWSLAYCAGMGGA